MKKVVSGGPDRISSSGRVAPGDCSPGAPTDPYGRAERGTEGGKGDKRAERGT